ncbi:type II toxin-antitoxin system Phd/YefM family antitoxin [Mycetocola zhadangensis]|uniref:Antitoxin n=2 Tax=Mycetocola zhadangensis TaxID=1164595 RepID=A0A3L7J156_9MICO|nr:type II toxin-antitoxin system prevent-host-death family antitoxin [Mycetocola zhadangensis]RLQ84119.1 type II toxin-antitoxin system prevent-host-death family antitoxin [Mycetocola zhadangensis]GGE95988.1 hypothetical protein GCM10011313_18690 [Mycetocola zhadangensis]
METVNILDARNSLSKLVSAAERGEDVVIAKRGKPVARLTAIPDEANAHTGAALTSWLNEHTLPDRIRRNTADLDEQILLEREAWE